MPRVNKVFGPGNAWVTCAKTIVAQDALGAAIDMPAGPSEVMVIADESANPAFVAADLLSQAEHGVDLLPWGFSFLGLPMPKLLCPEAVGLERVREGRYHFTVSVSFPFAGEVLNYDGWLEPVA